MGEFSIKAVLDMLDKNGTGVNFVHHHELVVARLGALREFSSLTSKDGVSDIVYIGEDVTYFAAFKLVGMEFVKWC